MKLQNIFLKSTIYLFGFIFIVFIISIGFTCHVNLVQNDSLPHEHHDSSSHERFGYCPEQPEILTAPEQPSPILVSDQIKTPNQQKFIADFVSRISMDLFNLANSRDAPFISSENLLNSQTSQLLTIVKIE